MTKRMHLQMPCSIVFPHSQTYRLPECNANFSCHFFLSRSQEDWIPNLPYEIVDIFQQEKLLLHTSQQLQPALEY